MTKITNRALAALCLLFSVFCFAQDNVKETAVKAVTDYFFLERENIHVQCNKNIYTTNEQIWFKGYVFHRKNNIPFFNTINIFANLIDDTGKILETKLIYGNIGSFSGSFKLNDNLKSGRYYLQFYTNWMNNFTEDESAVYEVSIINPATGAGNALAKADLTTINIDVNPEGGTLVSGINNIVGLHISDCNHEPTAISTATLVDASGKNIKQIQVNKLGYGRFDIIPKAGETYKIITTLDDAKHEKTFTAVSGGIAMEINSYSLAGKLMVNLRTSKQYAGAIKGKPLYMLIQKDEKVTLYDVTFDDMGEVKLVIDKTEFFDGINTIRLFDDNLKEVNQRLFYNYPNDKLNVDFSATSRNVTDTDFKGTVNYPNMNLSVSILPEGTRSFDVANDIYSSLLLLPYIDTRHKANGRYYFTNFSKGKMYELDLYLISQKSKYAWNNILSTPPKDNNRFDTGLAIKGTLPSSSKDDKYARVRLYSLTSRLDESAPLDENGSFIFDNLILADSSHVNFTLLRKGQTPKELTLAPQLLYYNRKFNKPYPPEARCYAPAEASVIADSGDMPKFYKDVTVLNEVKIEGTRLKYGNSFGNTNLTGYKISEMKANMYQTVLDFIRTYGTFEVSNVDGQVTVYSRMRNSLNAARSGPIIYLDNVQMLDYSMLNTVQMSEVDEVYINAHAIVPSVRNFQGIIKIYLHKGGRAHKKNTTPDIVIKGGFEKVKPFHNVLYNTTSDSGFTGFGVIDWQPQIMTDENGAFTLKVPNTSQKTVKVILEGFSADGRLISEVKTLNIQ
jgi:hypothetical protein